MLLWWEVIISIFLGPFQFLSALILTFMYTVKKQLDLCSFLVIPLSIIVILIKNYATNLFTQIGVRQTYLLIRK